MRYRWFAGRSRRFSVLFLLGLVLIISACGGAQTSTTPQSTKLAAQQVLAFAKHNLRRARASLFLVLFVLHQVGTSHRVGCSGTHTC